MFKTKYFLLGAGLFLAACSGGDDAAEKMAQAANDMADKARSKVEQALPEDPPGNINEALDRVSKAISNGEQSVSAADLKALLPLKLSGLDRVSYEAERTGIGLKVSKAQAAYGNEKQRLSLMITDLGAVSGLAAMGMELFETEIDKEDSNGFERTTQYKGHRSYQRMIRGEFESLAEIMVFVNNRFTVHLDGQNLDWERMADALDQLDLDRLQALQTSAAN